MISEPLCTSVNTAARSPAVLPYEDQVRCDAVHFCAEVKSRMVNQLHQNNCLFICRQMFINLNDYRLQVHVYLLKNFFLVN